MLAASQGGGKGGPIVQFDPWENATTEWVRLIKVGMRLDDIDKLSAFDRFDILMMSDVIDAARMPKLPSGTQRLGRG